MTCQTCPVLQDTVLPITKPLGTWHSQPIHLPQDACPALASVLGTPPPLPFVLMTIASPATWSKANLLKLCPEDRPSWNTLLGFQARPGAWFLQDAAPGALGLENMPLLAVSREFLHRGRINWSLRPRVKHLLSLRTLFRLLLLLLLQLFMWLQRCHCCCRRLPCLLLPTEEWALLRPLIIQLCSVGKRLVLLKLLLMLLLV